MVERIFKVFIVLGVLIVCGGSMTSWAQADVGKGQVEKNMPEERFIDLFHAVPWGAWRNISDEVSPYLLGKDQAEAVQFLKDQGFFKFIIDEDGTKLRKDSTARELAVDTQINAVRGPGWRFWRIATDYKVYLGIKNGEVIRVVATVDGFFNKMP